MVNFKQSRNWTFTDFKLVNWEEFYKENTNKIRFIAWGVEVCPTSQKKHNQGWIQLYNKKTLGGVKKLMGDKVHLECTRGTPEQNDTYCKKDGKYTTCGSFISQGERTDLQGTYERIMEGETTLRDVANDDFYTYCRYRNGFQDAQKWADEKLSREFRKVEVIVHAGDSGTGKTRTAMESHAAENIFKVEGSEMHWFDGYQGEDILIIDDYSNDIKITRLLNLLDGYKLRLPIKGSFTYARWTKVYITTNLTREELHPLAKNAHIKALNRRITQWINFKNCQSAA